MVNGITATSFQGNWRSTNTVHFRLTIVIGSPGCGSGNCLRSQVNRTETHQALVMVTKAGVHSQKLFIGMALYGRSFKMTDPGCQTEMCTYTGPPSGALPSECRETAGYISNYEYNHIILDGSSQANARSTDEGDILVYKGDQWVSFMTPATYNARISWMKGLNFGGASD
jgi:chitinase